MRLLNKFKHKRKYFKPFNEIKSVIDKNLLINSPRMQKI